MRTGRYDEAALEHQLDSRGLMNRVFGRLTRTVTRPRQMYPIGALFGLGFDTASEVALLVVAGSARGGRTALVRGAVPARSCSRPACRLIDTIDGSFMNFAYDWAFSKPVRKVFYNLAITGLSVLVALVIGTIEVGGLLASRLSLNGSFWTWLEGINLNMLGLVIVGMFLTTWLVAVSVWRLGRIEERWSAHLSDGGPGA